MTLQLLSGVNHNMAFLPTTTSSSATVAPAQMVDFVWAKDPVTGYYDIQNAFTPLTNAGNLAVIQSKIIITLGTTQGEWAPDQSFGLPEQSLLASSDNIDVLAQVIVTEILTVQNVNNVIILSLDYTPTTRNLSSSFNVNTAFGVTTVTLS